MEEDAQGLARLQAERDALRLEVERLRAELRRRAAPAPDGAVATTPVQLRLPITGPAGPTLTRQSPLGERVALLRSLFRGREDVYARRWESPDGRAGYVPAALSATHRKEHVYLPLTDAVIEQHLAGTLTIGVYPLLTDETCWFLAADFDKGSWRDDAAAYLQACAALDVPAALERSRSGEGGHVWIFFAEPVAAARARRLGESLLTRAMELRPQLGLDSYDRLFPNQDTLPGGGLGNLIALPLQRGPALRGHSLFVAPASWRPHPDQWAFLSRLRRVDAATVEGIVRPAERAGRVLSVREVSPDGEQDPWTLVPSGKPCERPVAGPLPDRARVVLGNQVYIAKADLPPALISRLWRLAAFPNPEFRRLQALRLSTYGKPRMIHCAEEFSEYIALPRGLLGDVRALLGAHGIAVDLADERQGGMTVEMAFHGELSTVQQQAATALLAEDCGVLSAPPAFGKTVIAAWVMAARGVSTLVIVHRQILVDQWRARLGAFLDLRRRDIGQIGAGRRRTTGRVDIALFQSLAHGGQVDDRLAEYGQVIVDECHHVPAQAFERVLRAARARFVLGLTATPIRRDGLHPLIVMQCGPVRFRAEAGDGVPAQVAVTRRTGFRLPAGDGEPAGIQSIYAALAADPARNALICTDAAELVAEGRTPLVLTERTDHLEALAERLRGLVEHVVVLRGGTGARGRKRALEEIAALPEGSGCVIVATGRYVGEGFDAARPDTLLLALPVSWRGTVWQYAGRIARPRPGKHEVRIYDYADLAVPVLAGMHRKRLRAYRAAGYVVQ